MPLKAKLRKFSAQPKMAPVSCRSLSYSCAWPDPASPKPTQTQSLGCDSPAHTNAENKPIDSSTLKSLILLPPNRRPLWTSARSQARGIQREVAERERTRRRTGLAVRLAKSANVRANLQEHGATRANGRKKSPTQTSWGLYIGGPGRNRTTDTRIFNPLRSR